MNELGYRSASECLALLRNGEVSSLELVDSCIARIEALNPELNAVVAKFAERGIDAHLVGMNRHAADLHERTSSLVSHDH